MMQTVKKHERRAGMHPAEAFAAMQLLHDPQVNRSVLPGARFAGPSTSPLCNTALSWCSAVRPPWMPHGAHAARRICLQTQYVPDRTCVSLAVTKVLVSASTAELLAFRL